MSDPSYGFLSVLRRGLAALIQPSAPSAEPRIAVPVSLSVGGSPVAAPPLALRGPGDVAGFDTGAIRRTWPAPGADNAEPNYFALLELSDADLPWRYSPDATSGDRLVPWLCLIVLEDRELGAQVAAAPGRPLAAVTVGDAGALPDLTQSWAWAHAQVFGPPDPPATDFDAHSVGDLLEHAPSRTSARLLCPRQLRPQTSYQACLVPTYERGRLAGLGDPTSGVDRLAPAWQPHQASVTLPVYFSWSFQTGEPGDFASLVAKLQPVGEVPPAVWKRNLAVSPPGAEPPTWQVVDLESALLPLDASIAPWPGLDAHGFTQALAARESAPGARLEPPLYGRWLAAAGSLLTAADAVPPWFHELNGDPRARVAAGTGTVVVHTDQQQLLAGAWAQVEGIRAANERLRLAQLARELALRLHTRHLAALDTHSVLELSSPVHAHVRVAATTVAAQLAASPIADGALAPAWRRAARPLGTLAVRQARPATAVPAPGTGVLERMNGGGLSLVPAPNARPPGATVAGARLGDLGAAFAAADVTPEQLHTVPRPGGFVLEGPPVIAPVLESPLDPAPAAPTGPAKPPPTGGQPPALPHKLPTPPAAADGFIQAASELMAQLAQPAAPGLTWVQADLEAASGAIKSRLDPIATIEAPLAARLAGVRSGPRRTDPLEPVMDAPEFPQPMYQPLARLGRDWLLPGLDQMTPNAVALFRTNWAFVESYLVGLNHELARKLLWNGYPTDQRGTYFRHFWDLHSGIAAGIDSDIGPIHLWTGPLAQNRLYPTDPLVLLVRGELIRRYPNVIVSAVRAEPSAEGRQPGAEERHPIFFGRVEPDVALFGFELDAGEARADPGWFFVLQEHPSEPRFGLAVPGTAFGKQPSSWDVLGWDHLAASADALASLRYIDLDATLPLDPVDADSAGVAWHANGSTPSRSADLAHITLRHPTRLAVHGTVLIPAPPVPPAPSPQDNP
jgi:hypothetical protein